MKSNDSMGSLSNRIRKGSIMKTMQYKVKESPLCDFCAGDTTAKYRGKVIFPGKWANMCKEHFEDYGVTTGKSKARELTFK